MKKMSLVLALLLLGACAHAPAQNAKVEAQKSERKLSVAWAKEVIVKGKTTQKEILEKIGVPNAVQRRALGQTGGAAQTWQYWTAPPLQAVAQGGAQQVFQMSVSFDDNDVVLDYSAADNTVVIQ
ncbi:hypothetical protein [Geomonas azotofigens]|uniref:hypothetical protein n=1 Tax=Geomonas azotofigens TaxID=2843196 RepID=UPI001C101547|nr:hypothetical protein [Geomonas azotofigens]MBU5614521.1 hypothetical protein [Geomonas azotofigens]